MTISPPDRISRLAAIVESSDDAIVGKDMDGTITEWSRGAERLYGYSADEVIGKPISFLLPPDCADDFPEIMQKMRLGESISHYKTAGQKKDGGRIDVSLSVSPLRDEAGKLIGAVAIAHDISQHEESALRESEERFRLMADTAPALIWTSTPDKLCNYFNMPWLEFTGRSLDSELGNGWAEGVHPEDLRRCLEIYVQSFDRREKFRMEYRLRRHDGEYRWVLDTGVPRFNLDGSFDGYIGLGVDVTDRKRAEDSLSTLSRKLIEAQEQERARIARELHDDTNQRLALVMIEIGQLKKDLPHATDEIHSRLDELRNATSEISTDLQALSHELHSSKLEYLGMIPAMKGLCEEFGKQHKAKVEFSSYDLTRPVSPEVSLCLFRILQEALHNAAKHSRVGNFSVQLRETSTGIHLTVRDSGAGFDPEEAMKGNGLGLTSMKERLHLVKGEMSIDSQPQRGTVIHARIPFRSETDSSRASG
jgi:PAS domain S-box-containing protein